MCPRWRPQGDAASCAQAVGSLSLPFLGRRSSLWTSFVLSGHFPLYHVVASPQPSEQTGRKRGGIVRCEHQPPGVLWVPLPKLRVGDIAGITGELVQLPERLASRSLTGGLLSKCGRSAWFVPQLPFSPSQGYSSEFLSEYVVFCNNYIPNSLYNLFGHVTAFYEITFK